MPSTSRPVLLFLHGFHGVREDLAWIAESAPWPWLPVLLQGPLQVDDRFAWFQVADDGRPGTHAEDVAPAADRLLAWIEETYGDATVAAVGWSQGGATALHALRRSPNRLAFVVTFNGFTTVDGESGDAALAERRPPVFWAHGENDDVIDAHDIARMREFLPAHSTLKERVYPNVRHEVSAAMAQDALRFVAEHTPPSEN